MRTNKRNGSFQGDVSCPEDRLRGLRGAAVAAAAGGQSMDFKGQYYCERFFQILVILFGLVGFVVGYFQQDFRLTFYFLATGGGVSAVVCARALPRPARTWSARRAGLSAAALHAAMSLASLPPCSAPAGLPAGLALVESAPARMARGGG